MPAADRLIDRRTRLSRGRRRRGRGDRIEHDRVPEIPIRWRTQRRRDRNCAET
jgi:hypothetical protein